MSEHKPLAPGTIVFHPARGYGVLTAVNLLTGWVSARFGNEVNTLDLSLCDDGIAFTDGTPILFRRAAPEYMPHASLLVPDGGELRARVERLLAPSERAPHRFSVTGSLAGVCVSGLTVALMAQQPACAALVHRLLELLID